MKTKSTHYKITHLPTYAVTTILVLSSMPLLCLFFSINPIEIINSYSITSTKVHDSSAFNNMLTQSILILIQWSSFILSAFAAILSFTKFYSTRDQKFVIIAILFITLGANDLLHLGVCLELFKTTSNVTTIVPYSWLVNRSFSALILLACGIFIYYKKNLKASLSNITIITTLIGILISLVLGYLLIAAQIELRPLESSPLTYLYTLEAIPLTLILLTNYFLFKVYRTKVTVFNHSILIVSLIFLLTSVLALYDRNQMTSFSFISSHYINSLFYILPSFGLILGYFDTIKRAYATSDAKSLFLANMSHEIRTPINGILCTSEMLIDDDDSHLNDDEKENLEIIMESANSLLDIVNNILEFSKVEKGEVTLDATPFSLPVLTKFLFNSFNHLAQSKKIFFDVQADENLPEMIIGDLFRIKQILMNLVSNAMKFTDQGSISVHIKKVVHESNSSIHFSIKDTGIGIKQENFSKLFQEFNQLDNSITRKYGGTGLGLSICRNLAKLMNGKIHIRSDFGQGSTFTLSIPLQAAPPPAETSRTTK